MGYGALGSRAAHGRCPSARNALSDEGAEIDDAGVNRGGNSFADRNCGIREGLGAAEHRIGRSDIRDGNAQHRLLRGFTRRPGSLGGIGDGRLNGQRNLRHRRRHGHAEENQERAHQPRLWPRQRRSLDVSEGGSVGQRAVPKACTKPS